MPAVLEGRGDVRQPRLSGPQVRRGAFHEDAGLHLPDDVGQAKAREPERVPFGVGGKDVERQPFRRQESARAPERRPGDEVEPVTLPADGVLVGEDAAECPADTAEAGDDDVEAGQERLLGIHEGAWRRSASRSRIFRGVPFFIGIS